ncbi:hypothetical protein K438DRAFT_1955114 [Mycena galopus ATCC 62051]|nr:hypothetical protein K438DRAFT_1955114 [Mycena galopus ATCC 62051]
MDYYPPHLLNSLLLALVAMIPSHTIRYSALGVIMGFSVVCTIYPKSPSALLHQLGTTIDETDSLIRRGLTQCPRAYITLIEQMGQLLEANKTASLIKCRMLASDAGLFNWNHYRVLSTPIAECTQRVKKIRTAFQASHCSSLSDENLCHIA